MGKKVQVDTFFTILNKLIYKLGRKFDSYNLFFSQFKFLINIKTEFELDINSLNI